MPTARQILERLIEEDEYASAEDFYERVDTERRAIVDEFLKTKGAGRVTWRPIRAEPVIRIWLEYGLHDSISDEDGLATIADQMMTLIARFYASTELCGHTSHNIWPEIEEDYGRKFTEEERDALLDMLENDEGSILSDYGLQPLQGLYGRLYSAQTPKDQLQVLDRMFNVVHQRGDLAAHFIQGGTRTLNKILDQGGYGTFAKEEHPWDAQVKAQLSYTGKDSTRLL